MIHSYKQLSRKYLKANRKRTVLTIIGIALSVALISTIGLFMKGSELSSIENAKKASGGSFQLTIGQYDASILNKIKYNPNLSYGILSRGQQADFNDVSVSLNYADSKALTFLKYSAAKGRLPKNDKEIAIESWVTPYIQKNLKLGDSLTLNGKKYQLVGLLTNLDYTQNEKNGMSVTYKEKFDIGEGSLLIEVHPKSDFKQVLEEIKTYTDKDNIAVNDELVSKQNLNTDHSIFILVIIVISIVVLSTIVVISNAIQISVVERIKQFGLLRSIGATRKQIRKIVLKEASILACIAIPIGLLCSVFAVYLLNIVFMKVSSYEQIMLFHIDWKILLISTVITAITVFASSYYPALYAGRISPLLAISSRLSIKKETIKRKKGSKFKKPYSFPLSLAMKNINRNQKRYQVTILSIIISCVLFITFSSLMNIAFSIKSTDNQAYKIDLTISNIQDNQVSEIRSKLKDVGNISEVYEQYGDQPFYVEIPINKQVKLLKEWQTLYQEESKKEHAAWFMNANIKVYDKSALLDASTRLKSGQLDMKQLNQEKGVILVEQAVASNPMNHKKYLGPLSEFKVGDMIRIQIAEGPANRNEVAFGETKSERVKIVGVIRSDIFSRELTSERISFITSEEVMKQLSQVSQQPYVLGLVLKDKQQDLTTVGKIETILKQNQIRADILNHIDMNRGDNEQMMMIKVLVYGFIVVISLIGSVNIINTITVSIVLRRKELAALKSIGMSQKDLKKMIVYEGLMYGVHGSVLGIIFGCMLSYIIYIAISGKIEMVWTIPYQACLIAFGSSLLISFLSVLIPLRKIQKDNMIDVIREE